MKMSQTSWIQTTAEMCQQRVDHVIITLVNIRGSAPQIVGSKMIELKLDCCLVRLAAEKLIGDLPSSLAR